MSIRLIPCLAQRFINNTYSYIDFNQRIGLHTKMVKEEIHVEGFDAFTEAYSKYKGQLVFALFCGSVNADGKSWCPDCVVAEPVIKECLKEAPEEAIFIYCSVGGRDFWKDKSNIFRTDALLKLRSVPTLIRMGTPQRLEEGQCTDHGMVKMLLCDED